MQSLSSFYNYQAIKAIELVTDSVDIAETREMTDEQHDYPQRTPNSLRRRRFDCLRKLLTRLEPEFEAYHEKHDEMRLIQTIR